MIAGTLLLICVGVTLEVVFTAACDYLANGDLKLYGKTTVWMLPIYALVYPAFHILWPTVGPWPWFVRGALYLILLYSVEYTSGWLLRRTTGRCPWDYGDARWAVHGVIRLDYAPAWAAVVFLFERASLYLGAGL